MAMNPSKLKPIDIVRLVHRTCRLAAFTDRPDHQRLATAYVTRSEHAGHAGGVAALLVGRGACVVARIGLDAEGLEHGRHRMTKPIASSTRSAARVSSLPGTSVGLPSCHSRRTVLTATTRPLSLPVPATNSLVAMANSRVQPSSWLELVRSLSGQ